MACGSPLNPRAGPRTRLSLELGTDLVVDGDRCLDRCLDRDDESVSDLDTGFEALRVVHALDVDRQCVVGAEDHRPGAFYDLVLAAAAPDRVVVGLGTTATGHRFVGLFEEYPRCAVPGQLANGGWQVGERDGEAVPFGFRLQ